MLIFAAGVVAGMIILALTGIVVGIWFLAPFIFEEDNRHAPN